MIGTAGDGSPGPRRVLLVTGLSGAGKSSIMRVLEDMGYEVVDNPPLRVIDEMVARADRPMAIGVDSRTRGFDPIAVREALARLRVDANLNVELIYATAEESVLLRRFTATRRRHPLATHGNVQDGITEEIALTAPLRAAADIVLDTSDLPPPELRQIIEARFAPNEGDITQGLTVALMSFAFPAGLPREADMVFDARFLRNPYYDQALSAQTGLDRDVSDYVQADPDYAGFLDKIINLLQLVLPRFVREGKKYATIAVGCSGGRHRSVTIVEDLARSLAEPHYIDNRTGASDMSEAASSLRGDWPIIVMHRELARQGRSTWRWARRPTDGSVVAQTGPESA